MSNNVGKLDLTQAQAAYDQALRDLAQAEQTGDARALTRAGRQVAELQATHPELIDRVEPSRQELYERWCIDNSDNVTVALTPGVSVSFQVRIPYPEIAMTRNFGKALLDIHDEWMGPVRKTR